MLKSDGRDYIYLIWKDPISRSNYIVGQLSKNGLYEFNYGCQVNEALKAGFEPLIQFEEIEKRYCSDILFPVFSSRLPDKKRRDIGSILEKYNLDDYDEYQLLKRSGARLPIDNLSFIDPILEYDKPFNRELHLAGPRYYLGCNGEKCDKALSLEIGKKLTLQREPENEYDPNAVKVLDHDSKHIGYLPRYYSESISKAIEENIKLECVVKEFNQDNNCNECVTVQLSSRM